MCPSRCVSRASSFFRLPLEYLVGHSLERLAQHHEAPGARVPGAEVDVAEPALSSAGSPFDPEHDEIERARRCLILSQGRPATASCVSGASSDFAINPS